VLFFPWSYVVALFSLFFCNFLGAHHKFSGQAWAEGKRGACNEPPLLFFFFCLFIIIVCDQSR